MLSFAGEFWQSLSLKRDHCPNIRILWVGAQPEVTDAFSLAGQLQKLLGYIGRRSLPLLEHVSMLQECVIHISDYLLISFIDSLPISIQRLVVMTHPGFHSALCINANRSQSNNAQLEYIEYLTRFHSLTHVGGFNWTQFSIAEEKDHFLDLSALTKLEYIGIEGTRSPFM
ncbi:hypothetical protein M422DRAFT_256397 [Sphaerobolus stellatus SS14]|uniref:Uncharacterized protein n=1 Tax=Sphaerobolus stellatus (strain SS14) TaxID=990650 RepID=A0A0C9VH03_SPHS4|nr:hypothetical protein M422DRAFT_256397 [Sphaerobolus stellatus SS14]